ncbi:MAG: tryptophan transporter [Gudongella sp.]|nr:tryptophan transporter [Gudongella sp.]
MNLKNNIFTTLLLAIGLIMHQITPGILGGMKFDFLIIFMIIAILLNPKFDNAILTGLLAGVLAAMTSTFPGGQLPNIIDKFVTCLVIYFLIKILKRFNINYIVIGLLGGIGTFVSGMVFLISALYIVGLPAPLTALVIGIVIPTAIINTIGTVFVYKIVKTAMRSTGVAFNH